MSVFGPTHKGLGIVLAMSTCACTRVVALDVIHVLPSVDSRYLSLGV